MISANRSRTRSRTTSSGSGASAVKRIVPVDVEKVSRQSTPHVYSMGLSDHNAPDADRRAA